MESTGRPASSGHGKYIRSIALGDPVLPVPNSGDLWTCAWAADGTLYVAVDDTCGFEYLSVFTAPRPETSNLRLCRLDGDPPHLTGSTVNPMREYGICTAIDPLDDAMWKAMGLAAVDGALYMTVSRHGLNLIQPHNRYAVQETWDASILVSRDGGKSWSPKPELGKAMFPGRVFSTPFFVDYGRDGAIPAKHSLPPRRQGPKTAPPPTGSGFRPTPPGMTSKKIFTPTKLAKLGYFSASGRLAAGWVAWRRARSSVFRFQATSSRGKICS